MVTALKSQMPSARWTRPEDAHMTLAFLGEVDENRVDTVKQIMKTAAQGTSPFPLAFGGLGAFPRWKNPRVVWLGIAQGAEDLKRIETALRNELSQRGFVLEARAFHPHLTLCRLPLGSDLRVFKDKAEPLADPVKWSSASMKVGSIDLIQSLLTPQGAVHTVISTETFPLSAHS